MQKKRDPWRTVVSCLIVANSVVIFIDHLVTFFLKLKK